MQTVSANRQQASKVAKWLVEQARVDEAIAFLCTYAVAGPNDKEGQQLLADAFRINPASPVAKMAFEKMEGVGQHTELDDLLKAYSPETLAKFVREMSPVTFRKAQLGFNNNVKYKGNTYHVQTEDSGLDKAHIITHLFADGGRIIKSVKRDYREHLAVPAVGDFVKGLMKGQHMEMVLNLREGAYDEVIEGRARGGMDLLTGPPRTNAKVKKDPNGTAETKAAPSIRPPPPSVQSVPNESTQPIEVAPVVIPGPAPVPSTAKSLRPAVPPLFVLFVERSLAGGPDHYAITTPEATLGSKGQILAGERFCHPEEGILRFRDGKLHVEDRPGGNGVFVRVRSQVEMSLDDEFIVGDQLFRVVRNAPPDDDHPDPGPTYFYPAPNWPSTFRIEQIFEGGAVGRCAVARGGCVHIGSTVTENAAPDIVVNDPLVSELHCAVEEQAGSYILSDLDSRTGVFIRLASATEIELMEEDEILIGRTRLRVHFTVN